jgi:hypothetical protein
MGGPGLGRPGRTRHALLEKMDPEVRGMKKVLSEEQYFLPTVGGILLVVFILLVAAIVRLKFYL